MVPDPPVQIIANGSSSAPAVPPQSVANGSGSSPAAPAEVVATVIPGSNAILVTGELTGNWGNPIEFPPLIRTSDFEGKMSFTDTGLPLNEPLADYYLAWTNDETPYWTLQKTDFATQGTWVSYSDTASPLDAVDWEPLENGGGTPVGTPVLSLAASDAPQTPQAVADGSTSAPSAPVQVVANGSGSSPTAPPVVIA